MIVQCVKGTCKQKRNDSSYYNEEEVEHVVDYINKVMNTEWKGRKVCPADIGVVSPYKKQCELIAEDLNCLGHSGITVGTAEVFQGQERQIMIVSTVRTDKKLGFVNNQQVRLILANLNKFFQLPLE